MLTLTAVESALCMALLTGCANIEPAPGRDAGWTGGGRDASAPGESDGGDEAGGCDFGPAGDAEARVRVLYLVPSDRTGEPRYVANLEQALRHVQQWMRDQLPQRNHFTVADPAVQVVQSTHPASWYAATANGSDSTLYFWRNALADASAVAGVNLGDPDDVWLLYIAADPSCGQRTFASQHVALLPENDLRGLAGVARVEICAGSEDTFGRCRWVGGMALMLSFALGVAREPGCVDADPGTPCDDHVLTQQGYITYPDTSLTDAQIAYLSDSPFMAATGLPECELDCSAPLTE